MNNTVGKPNVQIDEEEIYLLGLLDYNNTETANRVRKRQVLTSIFSLFPCSFSSNIDSSITVS